MVELAGSGASTMLLSLLGGAGRINPRNAKQLPSVVVLVGSGATAAEGVATARHLAGHHVNVQLFLEPGVEPSLDAAVLLQLKLFGLTSGSPRMACSRRPPLTQREGRRVVDHRLLAMPVDLAIDAIGETVLSPGMREAVHWCQVGPSKGPSAPAC